jgi:hypothetical protein
MGMFRGGALTWGRGRGSAGAPRDGDRDARASKWSRVASLRATALLTLVLLGGTMFTAQSAFAEEPDEEPLTAAATEVTATGATLNGVINPNAASTPGSYRFRYAVGPNGCEEPEFATEVTSDEGHLHEAVSARVEELRAATTYSFCLVARNAEEESTAGPTLSFTTPAAAPTVGSPKAVRVGSSTALVSAEVSPNGLSTSYRAEYVTDALLAADGWSAATRAPLTDGRLPAASGPVSVSAELTGLQVGSSYKVRFVATNTLGPGVGGEASLTPIGASLALPDERTDELVSTPGTGEPYLPPTPIAISASAAEPRSRLQFQAAQSGDAITYAAEPGGAAGTGETGPGLGNQWLANRTSTGWESVDITPVGTRSVNYQAFSSDLNAGILEGGHQSLNSEVTSGCQALYTRTSSGATVPVFRGGVVSEPCGHPLFAGASENESEIVFQSEAALTENAEPATELPPEHPSHIGSGAEGEPCMYGCNLYAAVGGRLTLVNVFEGHTVPNATFGGYAVRNAVGQLAATDFSNVVSLDGSRIFWTDTQEGEDYEHVYVFENGTHSVQVSGPGSAEYWTATPDGRYAYYTEAGQLWRFDTSSNTRESLAGEGSEVQGVVGTNQIGEDGASVYVVAAGELTKEKNARGEAAEAGQPNLFLLRGKSATFIATLSSEDNEIFTAAEGTHNRSGDWTLNVGERTAQVTPDGQGIAFQSVRSLTGYDNVGAAVEPEVFVYSSSSGALSCASCTPTGIAPVLANSSLSKVPISSESTTYLRRWVSNSGNRVFFDSEEPLVPQDTNGVQDVYEWESEGEGTCTAQNASPIDGGGCIYLLSGGTSRNDSFLVDADGPGESVFFEHVGPLQQVDVPFDHNELYDARVRGGFKQVPSVCVGSSCQHSGIEPGLTASPPASVAFSGGGNFPPPLPTVTPPPKAKHAETKQQKLAKALKLCRRDKSKRKRGKCEVSARKKYGAKAKTGSKSQRGSR